MKWYSHGSYKQHMKDLKDFNDTDEVRQIYMSWAHTIANRFDRTYPRIGVLDLTDLLQEGYVGFYKAWEKLNWKKIHELHEVEQPAMITHYIKLAINRHIIRAIARDRDTIRIPEEYYLVRNNPHMGKIREYQTDIFLSRTFSTFFTLDNLDKAESNNYYADELNNVLNEIMEIFLTSLEKIVIKKFYGMDEAYDKPWAMRRIGEYCSKSVSNIQNIKHRGLKKLKQKEIIEIIEKNIEYIVI